MCRTLRLLGFGSILLALVVMTPGDAFGNKKAKKKAVRDPGFPATPEEYAKLQKVKELSGNLVSINGASKTLTIRVEYPHYEPNPNYKPPTAPKGASPQVMAQYHLQTQLWKLSHDLMLQKQKMATAKNPQELQKAMYRYTLDVAKFQNLQMQYMAKMNAAYAKGNKPANVDPNNQPFKTVMTKKDYDLEVQDEVVVRKTFLGIEYDDTGNLKQYSEKEKAELRGNDKSKPGYAAKFDDVQPGQEVKVYLTPSKVQKKEKAKKAKPDDDEPVVDGSDRPTINMIVMTKQSEGSGIQPANPRKGKK